MATLEELEKEAQTAEVKLAQETEAGAAVDRQTMAASLTSCRTRIVTLNTQALASKGRLEGYMAERKKRVLEIKRYQALLVDLEAWLGEAQSTISSEIKLTSAKVVRDQIRASQVRMLLGCVKRPKEPNKDAPRTLLVLIQNPNINPSRKLISNKPYDPNRLPKIQQLYFYTSCCAKHFIRRPWRLT